MVSKRILLQGGGWKFRIWFIDEDLHHSIENYQSLVENVGSSQKVDDGRLFRSCPLCTTK